MVRDLDTTVSGVQSPIALAAAVGPLLGGFITTYLSWRVAFDMEVVIIALVLSGIRLVHDAPYTGPRTVDPIGALQSVLAMGRLVLSILVWALAIPILAALLGLATSFRMVRIPEPEPTGDPVGGAFG